MASGAVAAVAAAERLGAVYERRRAHACVPMSLSTYLQVIKIQFVRRDEYKRRRLPAPNRTRIGWMMLGVVSRRTLCLRRTYLGRCAALALFTDTDQTGDSSSNVNSAAGELLRCRLARRKTAIIDRASGWTAAEQIGRAGFGEGYIYRSQTHASMVSDAGRNKMRMSHGKPHNVI